LSVATNPLFIILLSSIWLKRRLRWFEVTGVALGLAGVVLATYPLLQKSYATIEGLLILLGGMIAVSAATVYYARIKWALSPLVINGWQVMLGGLLLLPFTLATADLTTTHWNLQLVLSLLWLIIPVSIIALQLWFYLVKVDAVRASLWMFLCPIFGFFYAYILLGEPITLFTWLGTALVITGLYLAQSKKLKGEKNN
jgi:drug/metabolite transporter (DMT)-like permease